MARKGYRQGEILFVKRSEPLETDTKNHYNAYSKHTSNVIREGETTGHCHTLEEGTLYINKNGDMAIKSDTPVNITHPEHKTLTLPKGDYDIIIQREYDEEKDRFVRD